jgi:peptidyl-prolyl cis-trans isomerase C
MKKILAILLATTLATTAFAQDAFLAKNDLVTVTRADFEAELARLAPEQQGALRASPEKMPGFIESILVMKTLAAQARQEKLDQSPAAQAEIRAAIDRVLAQRRLELHEATLKVPDFAKRAEELYKADPKAYEEKALYQASHIMVDYSCRTTEAAKTRAEEARKVLVGGIPLEDVVAQYSDDPTAKRNKGNLGWRGFDQLNPTLQETLPKLKKGEVSEPVSSNFGYHVIVLHDVKPARQRPFAEVRESIIEKLKTDYFKAQRQLYLNGITTDPHLKADLKAISALATAAPATPAAPAPSVSPALQQAPAPASLQSPALAPAPRK